MSNLIAPRLRSRDPGPDEVLEIEDGVRALRAALETYLTPQESYILKARFGLNGPERTLKELGEQFGRTKERVRQLERGALAKLRGPLGRMLNAG
jgi:RNA polymerase sigma factor (sigma-70 family)